MSRTHRLTIIVVVAGGVFLGSLSNPAWFGPPGSAAAARSAGLHLVGYAALGAAVRALLAPGWRGAAAAVAVASGFGVVVECLQFGLPYRTASVFDAALNGVGATVGVAASTYWRRRTERETASRTDD